MIIVLISKVLMTKILGNDYDRHMNTQCNVVVLYEYKQHACLNASLQLHQGYVVAHGEGRAELLVNPDALDDEGLLFLVMRPLVKLSHDDGDAGENISSSECRDVDHFWLHFYHRT